MKKTWKSLAIDAAEHPILFWGWNFDDAGPIEAMYGDENNVDNNTNRWVLLRKPTDEMIDYIKSLKFNIIIGDTKGMLEYISNFIKSSLEDKMLQKELAKRLKARYNTKMDGSGWMEVSSDGIPLCRIDSMLRTPNCPFVLFVGTKKLVKRKEFEQFISEKLVI